MSDNDRYDSGIDHEEVEDAAERIRDLANSLSRNPAIKNELANELHDIEHQLLGSLESEVVTHHENNCSVRTGTDQEDQP